MSQHISLHTHRLRAAASCHAVASAVALLAGCAVTSEAVDLDDGDALASRHGALIGGRPVDPDQFRSTVGIGDACTAAKVGARLFLTAAHCVAVGRPNRSMPPPEGFPPNAGVREDYLPGAPLLFFWGLDADDAEQAAFTIVQTSIHPSWWQCPLCQDPILSSGAADIALIEIAEETPDIPEARLELGSITPGAQVVKVGWGCEERTNIDADTLELGRFKAEAASVIVASEIRHDNSPMSDEQLALVDASYLVTAGHAQDPANASLCLGDSGGPLYLADASDPRIVGVNSNYTFMPLQGPEDLGGVSWTDWHTRTSLGALHGVGQWLIDLGTNTVGGGVGG